MARHHHADDETTGAITLLGEVEAAMRLWTAPAADIAPAPTPAEQASDAASDAPGPQPSKPRSPADLLSATAKADAPGSALVRAVRRLDADIDAIIAAASDVEILTFRQKFLQKLRAGPLRRDPVRRDLMLASRLTASLERAGRLMTALEAHRRSLTRAIAGIEQQLIAALAETKKADDGEAALPETVEKLENLQDVVEALIRHAAVGNGLAHKLAIEAERGIIVLRALTAVTDKPLPEHFSPETREGFAPLFDLSAKNMLSMREVLRRKHGVDENFSHLFPAPGGQPAASGNNAANNPVEEQTAA